MTPDTMQSQESGSNEQIADRILTITSQLIQVAGPEWVMQFLLEGLRSARGEQQGRQMQGQMMSEEGAEGNEGYGSRKGEKRSPFPRYSR